MNTTSEKCSLKKTERVKSRKTTEKLFTPGMSKSFVAFPLRVVFMKEITQQEEDNNIEKAKIIVSVSKKHFKQAVKRNKAKRLVREAYRKNKHILLQYIKKQCNVIIAFIWLDDNIHDYKTVENKVIKLLIRVGEKL